MEMHQSQPTVNNPKKPEPLGLIGFAMIIIPPVLVIFGLFVAWLTSCDGGQPRDIACIPDVAQWAKFTTAISFFLAFLTVPAGIIVSIIAIFLKQSRAWAWSGILLCAAVAMPAVISSIGF